MLPDHINKDNSFVNIHPFKSAFWSNSNNYYKCNKCNILVCRSAAMQYIVLKNYNDAEDRYDKYYFIFEDFISCDENIIKNIIE